MEFIRYIFLPALAAGVIQGVTGFGAGVVMMMFLPLQFSVVQSAGVSSAICMVLCAVMVYRYRKTINFKKIIRPAVLYLAVSSISIIFAKMINQKMMKIILGIFLIVLSTYFLFFSKKRGEPKGIAALLCIIISGICDGLFGIGGPLMVIYFLSKTHGKEEYLGTIQCFFFINVFYSTVFRIFNSIITIDLMPGIILGMLGILIGFFIANKIVGKLEANFIRKLTYILIGLCGLSNVMSTLL